MEWHDKNAWVAFFDVLGFKSQLENSRTELQIELLKYRIEQLKKSLHVECQQQGELHYSQFSDSIVIVAPSAEGNAYPWFLLACRSLITQSIYERIPVRGAVSVGSVSYSVNPPVFIGRAVLEAHEYCEDQDWIGLLLAPSAVAAARSVGLEPLHHHFASDAAIPLRKMSKDGVVAYTFNGGAANFESPLLHYLREMRQQAGESHQRKYLNTMDFISRHYQWLQ